LARPPAVRPPRLPVGAGLTQAPVRVVGITPDRHKGRFEELARGRRAASGERPDRSNPTPRWPAARDPILPRPEGAPACRRGCRGTSGSRRRFWPRHRSGTSDVTLSREIRGDVDRSPAAHTHPHSVDYAALRQALDPGTIGPRTLGARRVAPDRRPPFPCNAGQASMANRPAGLLACLRREAGDRRAQAATQQLERWALAG
jgi:hypothetical protein